MLRHNERVYDTTISPDGKKAATRTESGVIHIWNAENGMILNTYTPKKSVYDPHFVDEHTLIFWDYNGIYCIDADSLDEKWSYKWSHARFGIYMAVSSDRSKAALADMDLTVLDTATGQPLMEISLNNCFPDMEFVHGSNIVFDESGSFIFFSVDDGRIAKVDLEQRKITQVYPAAYDYVTGLAVSPDGKVAATSFESEAEEVYRLDIYDASGNTLYSVASNDEMEDPSFISSDSNLVVYTSYENLVILNIGDGTRHICAHGDSVTDYYIIDDLIVTTTYDGGIRFWSTNGWDYSGLRLNIGMYISGLDFVPGMIALNSEKYVVILRPFENSNALLLEGHSDSADFTVCLEGGRRLVSCLYYGEIVLWDLEKAEAVKTVHVNESAYERVNSIFSVDNGSKIMIFTDSGRLSLYDSATLDLIRSETFDDTYRLAISPDHSLCCLFGTESRIVDTSTLEIVEALSGPCSEAAFFNDNSKIILGSYKGLYLLDVPGRAIVKKAETADPKGLRLSHDNSMLALISSGSSVKLFDATNLEEKLTIECPGPSPESVFFDPSGKTIFISFSDFTIGRYSTADGTLTGMLDKKVEEVDDILYSLDRNIYITKGMHEAYIWKLDTHKPIGHIRGLRMADLESGRLYVGFYSKLFVLSLYDTQMLLDEAEKQLQGRTLTPEEKKRLFIVE